MLLKSILAILKLIVVAVVVILYIHYFIPQSWGFYTSDPTTPLISIYRVHNGFADREPYLKNNMSYGMGVSWKGKVLYSELYKMVSNKSLSWKVLVDDSLTCITQHGNYSSITADSEYKNIIGRFLIIKTERPSYSELKNRKRNPLSKQYVLADIR